MEAVGVESAGKFLIDRHFNDLENNSSSVIHLHAIFVTTTAHYSDIRKRHWQIDESRLEHRHSMEKFRNLTRRQKETARFS